jgi:hypothetical protein
MLHALLAHPLQFALLAQQDYFSKETLVQKGLTFYNTILTSCDADYYDN